MLRQLVQEGLVQRLGKGGRKSPFVYQVRHSLCATEQNRPASYLLSKFACSLLVNPPHANHTFTDQCFTDQCSYKALHQTAPCP